MKSVIVTTSWDDGHKLDYKIFKLLNKYGLKGTFYVCTQRKNWDRLDNSKMIEISKTQEIGAHTLTHPHLTKIPFELAKSEILESKKELEDIIGKEVLSFCYPFGDYNKRIKELVKKAGFVQARTVKTFHFNLKDSFEVNTTVYVFPRRFLVNWFYLMRSGIDGFKFVSNRGFSNDWELLAKKAFDFVLQFGGIWHLFGHSVDIDKLNLWEKLEKVFQYVSNRRVQYCCNCDLAKFSRSS